MGRIQIITVVVLVFVADGFEAKAVEMGQCFGTADISAKLRDKSQHKIASADEPTTKGNKAGDPLRYEARIFTSDDAGSVGYYWNLI